MNAQADKLRRQLRELIDGTDVPAYVYTYPPKGAYQPLADGDEIRRAWSGIRGGINLYVHIPFCRSKCSFCSLFTISVKSTDGFDRYIAAVLSELQQASALVDVQHVYAQSLYFGGGTPSLLSAGQLEKLLNGIRLTVPLDVHSEISLETSPDVIDRTRCSTFAALGFNRLSIGVQTFDGELLPQLGRNYDASCAEKAIAAALEAGIPNVNVDLIYGLAGQTLEQWLSGITKAAGLGAVTLNLYPLAVRERTKFGEFRRSRSAAFLDHATRRSWYDASVSLLTELGFSQHSLVTFAREKGGCRYESQQFSGIPTLAVGAGARSYAPALHYTNADYFTADPEAGLLQRYCEHCENGRILVQSAARLSRDEQLLRYFILGLLSTGVDTSAGESMFGERVEERFAIPLSILRDEALVSGGSLRLTPLGYRHSSEIGHWLMSGEVKELSERYA